MIQLIARKPAAQPKATAKEKLLAWTQGVLDGIEDDDEEEATQADAEEEEEDDEADDPDTTTSLLRSNNLWSYCCVDRNRGGAFASMCMEKTKGS